MQRVRQRDLQHVIAEGTIASEKNIKTEIGWIECLFHDEYEKDQVITIARISLFSLFLGTSGNIHHDEQSLYHRRFADPREFHRHL